ncbi:MAG: DUF5615 family PIN-like protein [Leptospiraceae bacterium]|nr:DUF5615 family PIN-like protein [Leptospiraceae bacterium]
MIIWVDAQLSPKIAKWITETFHIESHHVSNLNLTEASDREIFLKAKSNTSNDNICILTKDIDFVFLLDQYKSPPKIIWLTSGNASNEKIKATLSQSLLKAIEFLKEENLVEVR